MSNDHEAGKPPTPEPPPAEITQLLDAAASGDQQAAADALPLVYDRMRRIAQAKMAGERVGHTLQPTALVNEAYLRLFKNANVSWRSRGEFYFTAAEAMRRILIEHARSRGRVKRSDGRQRVPLSVVDLATSGDPESLLIIDDAIQALSESDEQAARVVQLRFYAGLSVEETALAMELSPRTVAREWNYARAWLARSLGEDLERWE